MEIQNEIPMEWIIARFGADEIILILPCEEEAITWVTFLRNAQKGLYYELVDNKLPIYAAFGWAKYPEDGVNFHELVKTAEFRRLQQLTHTTLREKELGDLSSDLRWALIETLSSKDVYTRIHSEWVATYLLHFVAYKNIQVEEKQVWRAGLLHDIGKLAIPDRILKKPGKLAYEEYELMKQHPMLGHDLIRRWEQGLGLLVSGKKSVGERGHKLIVTSLQEPIRRLFEVIRFDKIFPIYESVNMALQVLSEK